MAEFDSAEFIEQLTGCGYSLRMPRVVLHSIGENVLDSTEAFGTGEAMQFDRINGPNHMR